MSSVVPQPATLADLAEHDGKAELIAGRIVPLMPTGHRPSRVASRIGRSLFEHAHGTDRGEVFTATIGFAVPRLLSGRESFSPDVAYYVGPLPTDGMDLIPGPPTFAVEVRSKGDSGPAAEAALAAKRADYFEAGTLAVWDVDSRDGSIRSYLAAAPDRPTRFVGGQIADAGPAVPGWRLAVDDVIG